MKSAEIAPDLPVVVVCGPKKSGKTTLVERLLAAFRARGYRVGTVKHSAHKHLVDQPGTDSYRHRRAGATATLFLTPEEVAFFTDAPSSPASLFTKLFSGMDLVLVEGLSQEPWPKVVVLPAEEMDYLLSIDRRSIVAVVTEIPSEQLGPHLNAAFFKPGETTSLVSFLESRFALRSAHGRGVVSP